MGLISLSREKRNEIAQWLCTEIQLAVTSRSELDSKLEKYNELYEMELPPDKDWPWPNASKMFVPLIPAKVDSLVGRMTYSALKPDPLFAFKAMTPEGEQYAPLFESYYAYKTHRLNYRDTFRQLFQLAVRDGTAFVEVNRRKEIEHTVQMGYNLDGELVFRKEPTVVFDDDVIEAYRLKDVYLIPAYAEAVDKAFGIARRFWLRPYEAKSEVNLKRFYSDILDSPPPGISDKTGYVGNGLEDSTMGQINYVEHSSDDVGPWECFSILTRYDIDNDGNLELCRFFVQYRDRMLLSAEEYPYEHRELNIIPLTPMPRAKSPYGISLPGRLENLQSEMNADRNQRRDALSLSVSPPLKRLATSPTKLDSKPWGPGQIYDVNDPRDMEPIQVPSIPPEAFAEEANMFGLADDLSATPTYPLKKETTAREVSALQGDAVLKFDFIMQQVLQTISKVGMLLFWIDKQAVTEDGYSFFKEVNGKYVKMTVPPEAFQEEYEIRANGNFVTFDKERRRQDLLFLYDLLLKNPLISGIPEAQMPPNLQRIYHLTRQILAEWDVKDIDSIIGKEEEYVQTQSGEQSGISPGGLPSSGIPGSVPPMAGGAESLQALFGNPALLSTLGGGQPGAVGAGL